MPILDDILNREEKKRVEAEKPRAYIVLSKSEDSLPKQNKYEGVVPLIPGKPILIDYNGSLKATVESMVKNNQIDVRHIIEGDDLKEAILEGVPIYGQDKPMRAYVKSVLAGEEEEEGPNIKATTAVFETTFEDMDNLDANLEEQNPPVPEPPLPAPKTPRKKKRTGKRTNKSKKK